MYTEFRGVIYFAVSTSNANFANRVLDVWKTGLTTGRQVGIDYNPSDLTGSSVGDELLLSSLSCL
jgi:hypothetical protein